MLPGNIGRWRLFAALVFLVIYCAQSGCSSTTGCFREYGVFSKEANEFQSHCIPCNVSIDSGNTAFALSKLRDEISAEDMQCLVPEEDSLLKLGATVLTSSRMCLPPGVHSPFGSTTSSYLKHLLLVSAPSKIRLSMTDSLSNNFFFLCDSDLTPGTYNIRYDYGRLYALQSQPVFEKMNGSIISGAFYILLEIHDDTGAVVARQVSKIQIR